MKREDLGMQIVILDRGFVYIGEVSLDEEWVYIKNARNIRVWGTTKGLGQLVSGPTNETKLDRAGDIRAPKRALIALMEVDEKSWKVKEVIDRLDKK